MMARCMCPAEAALACLPTSAESKGGLQWTRTDPDAQRHDRTRILIAALTQQQNLSSIRMLLTTVLTTTYIHNGAQNQLMASACGYSLLSRHPETGTLSLHRLVQLVLHASLNEQEKAVWRRRILEALDTVFPELTFASTAEVRTQCRRYFSHVLAVLNALPDQEESQALLELLRKAADYLSSVSHQR
jgi:hypothetical protein